MRPLYPIHMLVRVFENIILFVMSKFNVMCYILLCAVQWKGSGAQETSHPSNIAGANYLSALLKFDLIYDMLKSVNSWTL